MNLLDHRFRSSKADGPDASQVQPSHWNDGHLFQGGANGNVLIRDTSDPTYGAAWASLGTWTAVPFNAGNFYPDVGTWTVPSVAGQRFTVSGKTMRYHVYIPNSTIAGASVLGIKLPTGFSVAMELHDIVLINDGGVFLVGAHLYALPDDVHLTIVRMSGAWGGGNTGIYLSTTIEIS